MRRTLTLLTALTLAGCQTTVGGGPSAPVQTGAIQLTLRVPPEALPGYQTATIPGGSANIVAMLSNAALLGVPRSTTIPLVGGQTLYTVTLDSLPVGGGYTLEAEARNGSGARLAYTNQLDPASSDPALGQPRNVNPFTNPPQSFAISSGVNNVNAGLRILPVGGTSQGATAGNLTGNAQVMAGYRRTVTVTSTLDAPAGYVTALALNTSSLVTGGKLRADMADLHVLFWDGARYVELYRDIESPNTTNSTIRFRLQQAIAASGSDANYLVTYGNNLAAAAPSDRAQVYDFYDGFEFATSQFENRGWTTIRGTATLAAAAGQGRTGNALNINSSVGDFNRDVTHYVDFPTNFELEGWFKDDLDAARNDWFSPVVGFVSDAAIGIYTSVAGSNFHYIPAGGAWQTTTVARTAGWHRYEFRRYNGTMSYLVDGTVVGTAADARTFKAITIRGGSPGSAGYAANAYWDDFSVRQYLSPEPAAAVGGETAL